MEDPEIALTAEEHAVVLGSLLGDGSMRCKRNALLEVNHSAAQREYVDWKYDRLRRLVSTPPQSRRTNGLRLAYRFVTLSLPSLTPYYRAFYSSGRKSIPEVALSRLSLAVWFMDDGSRSRRSAYLNTQQFGPRDQERLMGALASFGIDATLNRDKCYHRIRIRTASISRFAALIAPHLLPSMQYKLPL
jgi:hypothetical protein